MKKIILSLFTCLMCTSVFAQVKQIDSTELVQILEKNKNKENIFMSEISLNNMIWDYEGNLRLPSVDSEKYNLIAEIEIDFLRERLNYKNLSKYKVSFQLKSNKPKVYAVTRIEGIETVSEYKARLEETERILEEARLEEQRIAEEKKQQHAKFLPIYEAHLSKAKKYESEKRWCYALGSYYDAMGTVGLDPEYKTEAVKGYNLLSEAIRSGNPGHGNYNPFTIHDEWKKLLIDAEKYGCSFNPYEVTVGDLVQGDLDYDTKTASYSAEVSYKIGARYMYTIEIIEAGYKIAYKDDWNDLPKEWPKYSASYKEDNIYNINGAYVFSTTQTNIENQVYTENYNAFGINDNCEYRIFVPIPFSSRYETIFYREINTLIDCKFNIIDENGKELVKPVRCLLGRQPKVLFNGITPEIMNLIDNGKAFINPVGCYLQYGKYNSKLDDAERSFIKNLPEVQLPLETADIICRNNKFDKTYDSIKILKEYENRQKLLAVEYEKRQKLLAVEYERRQKLDSINFEMSKTEITHELYKLVMGENPSRFKGANNPVECVSWYDAIWFCNKLSVAKGYEPVYSVDGNTDITKWNYIPHQGNLIGDEVTQNRSANGYGLYDMSGNVWELCWDSFLNYPYICGGSRYGNEINCEVARRRYDRSANEQDYRVGFRIIRSVK